MISSLAEIHAQPSTSKKQFIQLKTTPADITKTIKVLSPLPKNTSKKKNTIQKAIEITSSPYKNQLEEKMKQKKVKVKKGKVCKPKKNQTVKKEKKTAVSKGKCKSYKRKRSSSITSSDESDETLVVELDDDDDSDDDLENICGKCNRCYYDKKGPKVDWIQCVRCHRWLHETCISNPDICDDCLQ